MSEDAAAAQGEPVTTGDVAEPEHDFTQDPVPVADQKAAGVAPEDTVTMADQKAGTPPPVEVQEQPAVTEGLAVQTEPVAQHAPGLVQGAANQSPMLPANAQAGAAKAHAFLGHLVTVAQQAQAEIERYVPAELIAAADVEAKAFIASVI